MEPEDTELGLGESLSLSVPLVTAATPEEVEISNNKSGDDDGSTPPHRRIFKVVAPANLPKGFRINVLAGNEEVVVIVPPGGVKTHQHFEGKEARPIDKMWSDSEFDCSPNYEGSFCYLATFLPIIGWGFIMRKLGKTWGGPWTAGILILCLFAPSPIDWVALIFLVSITTIARGAVRRKYNIPGSCFEDCICNYFCSCCTVLQSYRHMKRNGCTPCQGCGDRTVEAIQV